MQGAYLTVCLSRDAGWGAPTPHHLPLPPPGVGEVAGGLGGGGGDGSGEGRVGGGMGRL